jgi:hypothetical protein
MAWIESHQELARHPKTKRFARAAGISIPESIGYLHLLWWWALDFAQDGNLADYTDEDIADAMLWEGDPKKIVDALISSGFIDATNSGSGRAVHDWSDYAGRLISRRDKNRERMQHARSADNSVQRTCNAQEAHNNDVRDTCEATVPNRTVPNHTDINTYSSALPPTPPAGWNEDEAPVEDGAVNGIPQNGHEEALRECSDAYMRISGRTMPGGVTSEVLLRINDGVEPRVIIFAMGESAGKDVGYFRAIMRRLARDGIKTYAQLTASETKDGAKARAAPKPDYRDPSRYENMDMKGFTAAADDEFTIERLTAQSNGAKVP